MLRNYLLIAYRNLLKSKAFSLINILGLAIGMAACLIIIQYVGFEWSYDRFHSKADRIYRLRFDRLREGTEDKSIGIAPGIAPAMMDKLPEIENYLRLKNIDYLNNVVSYNGKMYNEEKVFFADSSFFSFFGFPLIKGSRKSALQDLNTALITASNAVKYFGDEDPIDKIITVTNSGYGQQRYRITGVLRDLPKNTHLNVGLLLSFNTLLSLDPDASSTYKWNAFYTYVLVKPNADIQSLTLKVDNFTNELLAERMKVANFKAEFVLQPLEEIHLFNEQVRQDTEVKGNKRSLYFLILISAIILVIAYVNYINLATSRAIFRAKEVGIRKVMGSNKGQLIRQFLVESYLLNVLAIILALTISQIAIPFFNDFTGKELSFSLLKIFNIWLPLILVLVAGAFLSGIYPAFILSSFKPVSILKGKISASSHGTWLRKSLIVGQFAATVTLIAGTLAVYQQIQYMRNRDLGVDLEQTLVLKLSGDRANFYQNVEPFKEALLQNSSVLNMTGSTNVPGNEISWVNTTYKGEGDPQNLKSYLIHFLGVDHDFIDVLDIDIIAGRMFSKEFPADENAIILSETALKYMGFKTPEEAINRKIREAQEVWTIIGVSKDFHQNSLKSELAPIALLLRENQVNYYSIKINSASEKENLKKTLAEIESSWQSFFPENPFQYFFLDEYFDQQYKSDRQFGVIFQLFSGLAISVACLGLFGLASFSITQRTKEIGMRKVLGATIPNVLGLLSKDFIKLLLWANILAWPITYFALKNWLENYHYRIDLNLWLFIIPSLLVLVIALLTITAQTWKAANANPVKSLKYE